MARIALVTAASRDIAGATARLAGRRGYKAGVTYDGPNEPLPVPDSRRLKHPA